MDNEIVLALSTETMSLWAIALGVGFIVAIVVATLLQMLLASVHRIDDNVAELWHTATNVARNTATTWQLNETGDVLDEIKAEALRHDALLSGQPQPGSGPASDGGRR